jgi:hypothetical protein
MVLGSGYVILSLFSTLPVTFLDRKPAPEEVIASIAVLDSSIRFNTQGDCAYISSVGTIRNESTEITADDIYLEVRYFDAEGNLIDAEGSRQYGLKLLPGREAAFSIRGRASSPASEYASHEVSVLSAKDARYM